MIQNNITEYTNKQISDRYLEKYYASPESIKTRKSALNYFFNWYSEKNEEKKLQISQITKKDLMDYFDYLNNHIDFTLDTKKLKWAIIKSFLGFCMEYYDDFLIKIPSQTTKWNITHKISENNKDVKLELEEIAEILNYLKINNFKYYLVFRIFAETGCRKGELINITYDKVNIEERTIETIGKRGRKTYYTSIELANYLNLFIESRKLLNIKEKTLFLSKTLKCYSKRAFNLYLKKLLVKIEIKKNITSKTFRSSLNTFRYEKGCPDGDLEFLLGHSISVNRDHYIKLNQDQKLKLFDKWYPYREITI